MVRYADRVQQRRYATLVIILYLPKVYSIQFHVGSLKIASDLTLITQDIKLTTRLQ